MELFPPTPISRVLENSMQGEAWQIFAHKCLPHDNGLPHTFLRTNDILVRDSARDFCILRCRFWLKDTRNESCYVLHSTGLSCSWSHTHRFGRPLLCMEDIRCPPDDTYAKGRDRSLVPWSMEPSTVELGRSIVLGLE